MPFKNKHDQSAYLTEYQKIYRQVYAEKLKTKARRYNAELWKKIKGNQELHETRNKKRMMYQNKKYYSDEKWRLNKYINDQKWRKKAYYHIWAYRGKSLCIVCGHAGYEYIRETRRKDNNKLVQGSKSWRHVRYQFGKQEYLYHSKTHAQLNHKVLI